MAEATGQRQYLLVGECSNGHGMTVATWAPKVPTVCPLACCGAPVRLVQDRGR